MTTEIVPLGQIDYMIEVTMLNENSVVNISTASVKKIKIWKPSGELIDGSGTFTTDGSDGKLYYKTVLDNLDEEGWYIFRGYIEMGSFKGYTRKGKFKVEPLT